MEGFLGQGRQRSCSIQLLYETVKYETTVGREDRGKCEYIRYNTTGPRQAKGVDNRRASNLYIVVTFCGGLNVVSCQAVSEGSGFNGTGADCFTSVGLSPT